ncbi:glycosyltransferase [Pseudomonas monteilii]|uniref:glycosyltransferase n=1 Tax=Pseudomonas TaxID=286 RepID=UPI00048AA90A|nr:MULTISPECIES: glycosyltransferase [Pseudomonas]KPM63625.1 glycosyl transferase family 2 [Pseudomonas putida]MBA1314348.1 glycosyltransferase [Pseudomonas monteilii]MCE1019873.1 glycosyltransferase [Pseudomonas monteilii]MCE1037190.1 glycosyltransferase [Pseudomonas monteilii]MCE1088986.1 glycosyltransferase [Pseudomonas monteilii]
MNEQSLVSIVIPAYSPRFFSMALQSALAQTHEHLEVLVCDDSEGDEIEEIVRSLEVMSDRSVRYMRNPRRLGFVGNLVHAVRMASGRWVKVLCDDDRLLPLCVARQVQAFEEHPEVSLVLAQRMFADANNYVLPMRLANARFAGVDSLFHGDDLLSVLADNPVSFVGNLSAAMMRRDQALKFLSALTEYEQGFTALLDMALFCCLLRTGPLAMVSDVLLIERLHAERLSKQPAFQAALAQEWNWLQQMLRQRGGEAAPAHGWVRHLPMYAIADAAGNWKEMNLVLLLSNWQNTMHRRIGSDCESYDELYQQWLEERQLRRSQIKRLPQTIESWSSTPQITVIVLDQGGSFDDVSVTLQSVQGQCYGAHELVLFSNREACTGVTQYALSDNWAAQLNDWLATQPDTRWFYVLRAGDRLVESALLLLAERVAVLPGLACIYSDEDAWVDGKPCEPVFKPDFNIDLMRSYPYVGRTLAFECEAVRAVGGFDAGFDELAAHDVLWRLVETRGPHSIEHIAEIQVHSAFGFAQWLSWDAVIDQSERVASAHLSRLGIAHQIRHDDMPLLNRIDYQQAAQPLVTLVVTCDQRLEVLQRSVMSVMERTAYPNYELVLVAAERVEPALNSWLDAMAEVGGAMLRILRLADGDDAATMINQAATIARGEFLLMLASGLEVCERQWLHEMLNHARRPEVAIVGAKVLDVYGKVVHAGLVLGGSGAAGPVCVGDDGDSRGYLQRLQVVQNWTAVSGDCLMVRKQVFDDLGGLDIAQFSMGLGEVDLCLRSGRQGYLVVWTPHAKLRMIGAAPASAPEKKALAEQSAFFDRWLQVVVRDPAYNPNLSLGRINFSLDPSLQGSWNPFCARTLPSVLALPINASAVGGYRVNEPFTRLEAAGRIVGRLAYEVPSPVQLVRMDPDIIVVQLRHTEEAVRDVERLAKYSNARRIFEIDDYVLQAPKKNSHARNKPKDIEQHLRKGISLCDRVVVTTQALADALSSMHSDFRVVPNMLNPQVWLGLQSHRGTGIKPRVGWGGGTSHGGDLEIIAEAVRELASEVHWVFFGMCPDELRPYIHEFHPVVNLADYPAKLASLNLDLALAPLEFHIFNDCKSNLRLLEYGACGYPVICTDTEAYRGYLPCTRIRGNSTREWIEAIRMHLADPQASYRMGDELREVVLRDYVLRDDNLRHWEWGWLAD